MPTSTAIVTIRRNAGLITSDYCVIWLVRIAATVRSNV